MVAVVSLSVAGATTLAMRSSLNGQLDRDVSDALRRATPPAGPFGHGRDPGPTDALFVGQGVGTVVAVGGACDANGQIASDTSDGRGARPELLSDRAVAALLAVPTDGEPHVIDVPGEGRYRVQAGARHDGCSLVVGLPSAAVDAAVGSLIRWELGLAAFGVLMAAAAGSALVRRQLRPLNAVARTAHDVAALPLGSGEITIAQRVPSLWTDPTTETGQVGAALNRLLDHVEEAFDARHRSEQQIRQFVADASHELRTPLTTIAGYAELARRQGDQATAAAALAKVEEESARMTTLVEDLLLLARLDAGRPVMEESVDLSRLAVEAVADAQVVAPEHQWRVELPSGDVPVQVIGDGLRLHQVLTNLLTNARKYTPAGTTVTVAVLGDGFSVRDDGPGFPPELVGTAFERFTRGDVARHREGSAGLGLALVAAIVAAHGGTVDLQSEPGDTRITVALGGG